MGEAQAAVLALHRGSLTRQGNSRSTSATASGVEVADARVLFPWAALGGQRLEISPVLMGRGGCSQALMDRN